MHPVSQGEVEAQTMRMCAVVNVETQGAGKNSSLRLLGDGVFIAKDVVMLRVPSRISVVGPDGEQMKPSCGKAFWITAETFDPYHLITEGPA